MRDLRRIAILAADDVARLGDYLALVDALERAHREPPAAVERIVYGPDGRAEKLLALPAWQDGEAIGIKLVTVFPHNPTHHGLPSVQAAIRDKSVPRISTLIGTTEDEFYDDDTGVHYAMARYLCYWLQERGVLVRFVQLAQRKKDATAALEEVLGAPVDDFQREWEDFVMGLKRRRS